MATKPKRESPSNIISPVVEEILHQAFVRCREKRHKQISVEHMLLSLAESAQLAELWNDFQVDQKSLSDDLATYLDENTSIAETSEEDIDVDVSLGFQRVVQRAILHVQSSGRKLVEPISLLISIFGEKDSYAVGILTKLGVSRLDFVNYLAHGIKPTPTRRSDKIDSESVQFIRYEVAKMEDQGRQRNASTPSPPKLFVSYSHADSACLERLLVHLRPLQKSKAIACWSDKSIRTGDKWRQEIRKNLDDAAIAILLVSADFLASDFIVDNELPPLLVKAEARGIRILPVILKPCGFTRDAVLSSFQAINDPSSPLLGLTHIEQEAVYNRVADEVAEEIRLKSSPR
jgi:hypothetical protein